MELCLHEAEDTLMSVGVQSPAVPDIMLIETRSPCCMDVSCGIQWAVILGKRKQLRLHDLWPQPERRPPWPGNQYGKYRSIPSGFSAFWLRTKRGSL